MTNNRGGGIDRVVELVCGEDFQFSAVFDYQRGAFTVDDVDAIGGPTGEPYIFLRPGSRLLPITDSPVAAFKDVRIALFELLKYSLSS